MKRENGVTLVNVIVMIIIISVIAVTSVLASKKIFGESKEEVKKQNQSAVQTVVSRYSAQVATSGTLSPANITLPGTKNPLLDNKYIDATGTEVNEKKNIGEDWYLLSKDDLEKIGVTYIEETYIVNYKKNVVIPLSSSENIFDLVNYYDNNG